MVNFQFPISNHQKNRGFTLVELMVSIGIFVFMTALLIAKYGNFNQTTFLTNLAYDVAITLHTAQTYGLSSVGQGSNFSYAYGVHFDPVSNNKKLILFSDNNADNKFDQSNDSIISTYNITHSAIIGGVCKSTTASCSSSTSENLDIIYKRPNPEARICDSTACISGGAPYAYAKIVVQAVDGSIRSINVYRTGQISIE